ncbi:hypothetical protein N7470_005501 [Penicillium chermesinum]|nr:hypothetical protein N7470_005501 [Penicillium chermesinum]
MVQYYQSEFNRRRAERLGLDGPDFSRPLESKREAHAAAPADEGIGSQRAGEGTEIQQSGPFPADPVPSGAHQGQAPVDAHIQEAPLSQAPLPVGDQPLLNPPGTQYQMNDWANQNFLLEGTLSLPPIPGGPEPGAPTSHTRSPFVHVQPVPSRSPSFDYTRGSIVPNADIQVVRAGRPNNAIAFRLSDFLLNQDDPHNISRSGDWLNSSNLSFAACRQQLTEEGFYHPEQDAFWWSPHPLHKIDITNRDQMTADETRLTAMNLASNIQRSIDRFYPGYRNPSPDLEGGVRPWKE